MSNELVKVKPFVNIVESVNPKDLVQRINEGTALAEALRIMGIPVRYKMVYSKEEFIAFTEAIILNFDYDTTYLPVLHISTHGDENGIIFTNGTTIKWSELGKILTPVNRKCKKLLTVAMSSCKGFNAWKSILGKELPYFLILGFKQTVLWDTALIAYQIFYYCFTHNYKWNEIYKKSSENLAESIVSKINGIIGENLFSAITTPSITKIARYILSQNQHNSNK